MQVAIDTSTDTASLALVNDKQIIAELSWNCGHNHTTQLLPNLQYLLDQASLTLAAADCIFVAKGPGSYNGLRVGISTARGLAFSLGIPVIGISTLEAEAWQYAITGLPICPILNAGREEISFALYRSTEGRWEQLEEEQLSTVEDLCSRIETKTVFCGEHVRSIASELTEKLQEKALLVSPVSGIRRAGFLAELALKRMDAGDFDDTATLQPHYFRGPSITKPNPGKK